MDASICSIPLVCTDFNMAEHIFCYHGDDVFNISKQMATKQLYTLI